MESTAQLVQVLQNPLAAQSEVESAAEKLCKALSRLGFSKLGPIVADARQACTVISQTSIPGPAKDAVDKLLRCLPPSSTKRKLGGPDVVDCRKLDGPIECATWSAFRDNRVDTDVMELDDFSDENAVGIATTAIEAHRSPQVMVLRTIQALKRVLIMHCCRQTWIRWIALDWIRPLCRWKTKSRPVQVEGAQSGGQAVT